MIISNPTIQTLLDLNPSLTRLNCKGITCSNCPLSERTFKKAYPDIKVNYISKPGSRCILRLKAYKKQSMASKIEALLE